MTPRTLCTSWTRGTSRTLGTSLLAALAMTTGAVDRAAAQSAACCPQPTVALSPVVAPQPVVLQTFRPVDPWYPGKYLTQWLTRPFRQTAPLVPVATAPQPTFVTAAFRPTFAPVAGVTTVARPVALATTTFNNPCCPTTTLRPVTLTALNPCDCCSTCGVTTAGFNAPCPNCAAQPATTLPATSLPPAGSSTRLEPTPALPPNSLAPENRVQRLPVDDGLNSVAPAPAPAQGSGSRGVSGDESTSYWDPPQLFDARDRSAQRPRTSNVWNAVYHQPAPSQTATVRRTAYRPASQPAPRNVQVGASGWRSAD